MNYVKWEILIGLSYKVSLHHHLDTASVQLQQNFERPQPTKADKLWSAKYIGSSSKNFREKLQLIFLKSLLTDWLNGIYNCKLTGVKPYWCYIS